MGRTTTALLAIPFLWFGTVCGFLFRLPDTCHEGMTTLHLYGGLVLGSNLIGMLLASRGVRPWHFVLVAVLLAVPTVVAISYTEFAIEFWHGYVTRGMTECEAKSRQISSDFSGYEPRLIATWIAAAALYWIGLANLAWQSFRKREFDFDRAQQYGSRHR